MAKPISHTPILSGKQFIEILEQTIEIEKQNANEDKEQIQKITKKGIALFEKKFPLSS